MNNNLNFTALLKTDSYLKFYNNNKHLLIKIFIITFVVGLLIHSFRAHQTAFAYDALVGINFYDTEISFKLNSGRYLALFNVMFRGAFASPLFLTLISLFWMSLAIFFTAKLLDIKSNALVLLLCGIFLTHKTYIFSQAVLIHEVDIFMLAMLMSVLSVYVVCRFKRGYLIAPILVCLVCTAYQAYLCYILALISSVIIYNILKGNSYRENIQLSIKLFSAVVVGLALYYLLVQFRLNVLSSSNHLAYNAPQQSFDFLDQDIIVILAKCVKLFINEIITTTSINTKFTSLLNILFFALSLLSAVFICVKMKIKGLNLILLVFCVISLPFFLHAVTILSSGMSSASMRCAFEITYILGLVLIFHPAISQSYLRYARVAGCFIIVTISFNNASYANQLYLKIALDANKIDLISNRIIYEIEHTASYIPNETPVVFIGSFSKNETILPLSGTEGKYKEFPLDIPASYDSNMSYAPAYFRQIIGYRIKLQGLDPKKNTDFIKNMPNFPHSGYCQVHEGILYVKISELEI